MDWYLWHVTFRCFQCASDVRYYVVSILPEDAQKMAQDMQVKRDEATKGTTCTNHNEMFSEILRAAKIDAIVNRIPPVKCTVAGVPLESETAPGD